MATGKLLLFLDDDIVISKQSVAHVLQLHQEYSNSCFNLNWEYDPDVEALLKSTSFGRFLKFHRMTSFKGWYNDPTWVDNAIFPSTSVASFHLSIEKSVFEKTGGYNESFPFAGFEDYDFPRRLKKIAVSFFIDTRVTVFHNEIDKLNLHTWLLAQQRRATTRKVGSLQGYPELALTYGRWKTTILELVSKSERLWMTLLGVMPNTVVCDAMYFKILSLVQSGRIYKGYTDRK